MKGLKKRPNTFRTETGVRPQRSDQRAPFDAVSLLQQPVPRASVDEVLPSPSWRHRTLPR